MLSLSDFVRHVSNPNRRNKVIKGVAIGTLTLCSLLLLPIRNCKAQELTLRYIGFQYNITRNNSFINKELKFLKENKDTLEINLKLPFDTIKHEVFEMGIYYRCFLEKDTIYTIRLEKICINDMLDVPHSYYKINAIPDQEDCSAFTEIEKNTKYNYNGNYEKYVDVDNVLYRIVILSPTDGCHFH